MAQAPMRRGRRAVAAGLVAAGLVVSATACASGDEGSTGDAADDGPVTISFQWWGNDERAVLTEEALDLFEEKNPGVTVETSFSAIDAYIPKLATQIASVLVATLGTIAARPTFTCTIASSAV